MQTTSPSSNSLKATAALASITFARDQRQLKAQAVSQQVVDTDEQNLKVAEAHVLQQQATVDYKVIRAPFAGSSAFARSMSGNICRAGTVIVTLQALDPTLHRFHLAAAGARADRGRAESGRAGRHLPGRGISRHDRGDQLKVDTTTRNIQVRATLANPRHRLLPGMFATVAVDVGKPTPYVTLPQTAITYNPYGSTVYIVDDKGKDANGHDQLAARQVFVTTGATRGDQVAVRERRRMPGTMVVTAGQMKLRNGSPLKIDNSVQPSDDANPKPQEE